MTIVQCYGYYTRLDTIFIITVQQVSGVLFMRIAENPEYSQTINYQVS